MTLSPIQTDNNDYQVYAYRRRLPTKEEVKAYIFKDELSEAKELIARESGDNPMAINPTSGAGGVPQALPVTKMGCNLSHDIHDYACQVKWMANYIKARYGTVRNALAFHDLNNYY